jgi:hypothetical protein
MPIPLLPAIVSSIIESVANNAGLPPAVIELQTGPVAGLTRTLPADALRGQMSGASIDTVQIDGRLLPLSPAARIRNEMNIITPPTMVQQTVPISYLVDGMGYVSSIWILSPAELAASR